MSNGSRHVLGAVAGLLLSPLAVVGLLFGVGGAATPEGAIAALPALGVLAGTAVVLAFLAGSRMSPIASLLAGLTFAASSLMPAMLARGLESLPAQVQPGQLAGVLQEVLGTGLLWLVAAVLLVASLFPSRWRASVLTYDEDEPEAYVYPPQGGPEDSTRPMYRQ
ncbi:hypothetical protein HII36_30995 [Nonomuraea sp. NN258]|uniref:hypothetical protein n=1 Tax=Nonomuraea antri TaxID=2730852 RepID=UPI0015684436|nr:hypothetical protein [Nonomuraea antri]NRQ36231.1 hypothetical protein [Nonomuraea antri]